MPSKPSLRLTSTDTTRYGTAVATSWDRVHPRLTRRTCWIDHEGELPVIEGTLSAESGAEKPEKPAE